MHPMQTPMSGLARRHLLCITGLTPQVVTETLYALYRENPAQLPTDIHVLSTDDGIVRADSPCSVISPAGFTGSAPTIGYRPCASAPNRCTYSTTAMVSH